MQCSKCGKKITDEAMFCPQCGMPVDTTKLHSANKILYKLSENTKRSYAITVDREKVSCTGDFWYLKEKEFIKCKNKQEIALIENFLGMGYLAKRSQKKCLLFVIFGSGLEVVKMIVDKLTEWIDKANNYLQWIDKTITIPEWINYIMNTVAGICILLAVLLFFSKKKVIEISFTDKRICVPQNSMTKNEYNMLYKSIVTSKNNR